MTPPRDRNRERELGAFKVLIELLVAARAQVDPVTWRREGGPDAEDFLHALDTGAPHPLLQRYDALRATWGAKRPGPDLLEQGARRGAVLMCKTLHRAGVNHRAARKQAAKALQGIFPATSEQIRYWQDNYSPAPDDEKWIAAAIKWCGHDHERIAGWFAASIRFNFDPIASRNAVVTKVAENPPSILCNKSPG